MLDLPSNDQNNTQKLLLALEKTPDNSRSARFHCVMVFLSHPEDPSPLIAHGIWEGQIIREVKGDNGFGYDPVFLVTEKNCTSAELDPATKNRLSHRGKALRELLPLLIKRL